MLGITSILALVGAVESLIQDTPQAIATFNTVKGLLTSGSEPTQDQWAALDAQLKSNHAALQGA